jgi:hypothetical protein
MKCKEGAIRLMRSRFHADNSHWLCVTYFGVCVSHVRLIPAQMRRLAAMLIERADIEKRKSK